MNTNTNTIDTNLNSIRHHAINSVIIPKKLLALLSVYKLIYKSPVEFFSHIRNNQLWIGETAYTIVFNGTSFVEIKKLPADAKISVSLRQIAETGECYAHVLVSKSVK